MTKRINGKERRDGRENERDDEGAAPFQNKISVSNMSTLTRTSYIIPAIVIRLGRDVVVEEDVVVVVVVPVVLL
jgi:hypothetical protein